MTFFAGARERQQLLTVFALSNKFQSSDISLAVSSSLPSILYSMCPNGLVAAQPLPFKNTQSKTTSQLPLILNIACGRLLQIITVTVRLVMLMVSFL